MDALLKIVLVLATIFELNWAQLQSCDKEKDPHKICSKGPNGFSEPFPVKLNTTLYLEQIVGIDEDEKSISVQMGFIGNWKVSGLHPSNTTKRLAVIAPSKTIKYRVSHQYVDKFRLNFEN